MPSAKQDDGAKRRAAGPDGQASCASSAGLVDVLEMLFACRGPMPLNSATTPRRYEAPAAATSAGQADDENSSSQSGQESRSSSWGSYKYRPSQSFSKIDEEVLRELEDEELGRLRAQGVVAPRAIRHETITEYHGPAVVGSIKEVLKTTGGMGGAQPPLVGTRRVTSALFQGSGRAYAELKAAGGMHGPPAEFSRPPEPFQPSLVDNLARSNHGRSPAAPAKFFLALLFYPVIAALNTLSWRNVGQSLYDEFPLSSDDVSGWLGAAGSDLNVVAKALKSKFRPTGVELRALQEGRGIVSLLTESKLERRQASILLRRVHAMLQEEAELLSPFMLQVCGVVAGQVAAISLRSSEADGYNLKEVVVLQFEIFFRCFLQMLHRRYYQPCSQYGCSPRICRQIIWLTGGSPQSMLLLLPLAKQRVYAQLSDATEDDLRSLSRQGMGALCRAFADQCPDL